MDQTFWNSRYGAHASVYGEAPNQFFREQLDKLKPGRVLLPAEGEGRNAIYAAASGWTVDAFDFSEVAKQKADAGAQSRGLTLNYWLADMEKVTLKPGHYDSVGLIYVHMKPALRDGFLPKCITALRPGGTLLIEVYSTEQLKNQTGGPKDVDMLYTVDILRKALAELDIKQLAQHELVLEEGDFHSGLSNVIRVVANKK